MRTNRVAVNMRRFVCGLMVLYLGAAIFVGRLGAKEDRMTPTEAQKYLRSSFRQALTTLSPNTFTPVSRLEDIVNQAYFDSRHWMHTIFGEARDPDGDHLQARHFYYIWRGGSPGFDLVQHRYTADSRELLVTESNGIIQVVVRPGKVDEALGVDPAGRAARIANSVLQLPREIRFVADQAEGWLVSSTEPEKEIEDWKDRIYAYPNGSMIELYIYKKEDSGLQPPSRNYSVWFDTEFRTHPPVPVR
jgi:hypothetical protein